VDDSLRWGWPRGVRAFSSLREAFRHSRHCGASFMTGRRCWTLFLFTPLVAGWAVVVGMAVSVRATSFACQQLGMPRELPVLGVIILLIMGHSPHLRARDRVALGLFVVDVLALRLVTRLLIESDSVTGSRARVRG